MDVTVDGPYITDTMVLSLSFSLLQQMQVAQEAGRSDRRSPSPGPGMSYMVNVTLVSGHNLAIRDRTGKPTVSVSMCYTKLVYIFILCCM